MTLLQVTSWIMFYCQRKLWILQTGFANVPLLLNMRLDNLFEVSNYFGNCENIWKDIINSPWNTCILLPSLDHLFTKFFSFLILDLLRCLLSSQVFEAFNRLLRQISRIHMYISRYNVCVIFTKGNQCHNDKFFCSQWPKCCFSF